MLNPFLNLFNKLLIFYLFSRIGDKELSGSNFGLFFAEDQFPRLRSLAHRIANKTVSVKIGSKPQSNSAVIKEPIDVCNMPSMYE